MSRPTLSYKLPTDIAVEINAVAFRDLSRRRLVVPAGHPTNLSWTAALTLQIVLIRVAIRVALPGHCVTRSIVLQSATAPVQSAKGAP